MLLVAGAAAGAQDLSSAPGLRKLGLSDEEIRQVTAIQAESRTAIQKARAEIQIVKAQLARLLLNADAAMADVEKVLRAALEWELAVQKTEIERELKIRKLVGDGRWGRIVKPRIEEIGRKMAPWQPLRQRLRNLLQGAVR